MEVSMLDTEKLDAAMADALSLNGAIAASVVDWKTGMVLCSESRDGFDIELASAGNAEVVKAKMQTMKSLQLEGDIEDILITLSDQFHIIRTIKSNPSLFLYLAVGNGGASLAMAKMKMASIEEML